jgi:VWFA-related protein
MKLKTQVRLAGIAAALVCFASLALLAGNAAAANVETIGSSSSSANYAPAPSGPIELAQASQSQNFQPGYLPPPPPSPNQGGSSQTLDLPRVAPQSSTTSSLELPRSQPQGDTASLEAPIRRQPQTAVGRISVTATDNSGRWVQDLRTQDLTVYEDGVQRPILGLQRDSDTPITIGLIVDTSGSMAWKLSAAEAALRHFVRTLNPRDQVFLVAFSSRSFLLQNFTNDPGQLDHAIDMLHAYGQTALFDAVVQGLQKVQEGRYSKRALLVMTDGMDNESSHTLDDAIQLARSSGVLIYTVGLGTTGASSTSGGMGGMNFQLMPGLSFGFGGGGFHHHQMGGGEDERVDADTLRRLSDETGATTFVMNPRVTDMSALDSHFQQISNELRAQYTVRYESSGGMRPHQIRVEGRPGIEVRAPRWAGGASSTDYGG